MEKFAVDLDKVLDELEFNEDRAENLMTSGSKRNLTSVSQDCSVGSAQQSPHAPSDSGDQGTRWRPKPVPIAQKTSVSGVFSSLNEYLNSGRVNAAASSSAIHLPDVSSEAGVVGPHPPIWSAIHSSESSTVEEKPDLIDSSIVRTIAPTSAIPNETADCNDRQSPVGTLLPDIATAGAFIKPTVLEDSSSLDLLCCENNTCGETSIIMSAAPSANSSIAVNVNTPDVASIESVLATSISLSNATSPNTLDVSNVNTSDAITIEEASDKISESACVEALVIEDQSAAHIPVTPPKSTVLSFGALADNNELDDDELDDYLSDLELEEQVQEQKELLSDFVTPCELKFDEKCNESILTESLSGSQTIAHSVDSKEMGNAQVTSVSALEACFTEGSCNGLNTEEFAPSLQSEVASIAHVCDESPLLQTVAKDTFVVTGTTLSGNVSVSDPFNSLAVSEELPGNSSIVEKNVSTCSEVTSSSEPQETIASSQESSKSLEHLGSVVVGLSEELVGEPLKGSSLPESDVVAQDASGKLKESFSNFGIPSTVHDTSSRNIQELADAKPESVSLVSANTGVVTASESLENELNEKLVSRMTASGLELGKKIPLTLSLGETFSPASNSSPSTPPTVPVTPTFEGLPPVEEFASTLSTSSTPFLTPTAFFSESNEYQEETNQEEDVACTLGSAIPTSNTDPELDLVACADLCQRPVRPSSLEIPVRTEPAQAETTNSSEDSPVAFNATVGPPGETPCANKPSIAESLSEPQVTDESATESSVDEAMSGAVGGEELSVAITETLLGKEAPFWVPDADAPCCMQCDFKFTVIKRRHHCRACGKVLCSKCCSEKAFLEYNNAEARVCVPCKSVLSRAESGSPVSPQRSNPNPNNPMEYCSTVSPLLQVAGSSNQTAPSVMVPVGVLKREGSTKPKSEAKQVMFSDGIRPGADLAELDGSSEPRLSIRRTGRTSKRVGTPPGNASSSQRTLPQVDATTLSYVPHGKALPPVVIKGKDGIQFEEDPDPSRLMAVIRDESAPPVKFTVNRNLYVLVKILNLDCCVNRVCWCFTSDGLSSVGQDEIVIILEVQSEESSVPKDIFIHLNTLFMEAAKGNTVTEMGHTLTQGSFFLGSKEHGGFLYVRPTFQCLHRLVLPPAPYLVGVLIHKWETPWARVFPIRLLLRLGAEFRYYPCPLVSIRQRSAVYGEIGHTIIQVLADFRNMAYTLPTVRGLVIHMEDKQTTILLPRNRYDQVMRALNNSNDHVLAFGANFSQQADSHLVCMQSDTDHSYHTQAINIHNKPRRVTGASFVVFNGALKPSCGMAAKSSIVEDGLMVKVTGETMASLKTALRDMKDLSITCGPINPSAESVNAVAGISPSDEIVLIKWAEDDKSFNIGVLSSVDGNPLDGVPSIRVHNGTDYHGEYRFIRWTEVFILQSEEGSGRTGDPMDISRLSEQLAKATCLALVKLLDLLATANLTTLAVRATIHPENVGYQAGSNGEKLPPIYMNSLDDELVPVLHEAGLMSGESPAVLELVFRIMESG